jgi:hypothetical protein
VVAIQVVGVLLCMLVIAKPISEHFMESRARAQAFQLWTAIQTDDVKQFLEAHEACGNACADRYSLDSQLADAARANAFAVTSELVRMSAKVEYQAHGSDLTTCEGMTLDGDSALISAVVHHNVAMVKLLLPVSDTSNRQQALWAAAQVDRLDMVQLLVQAGVPLNADIRGEVREDDNSVLAAAASGAAMHVGQWLIESNHMSVEGDAQMTLPDASVGDLVGVRRSPLEALYWFVYDVGTPPRVNAFRKLLVSHGAALGRFEEDSSEFLKDSVDYGLKEQARFFLDAGAKWDPEDDRLGKLLSGATKPRDRDPITLVDCIKD